PERDDDDLAAIVADADPVALEILAEFVVRNAADFERGAFLGFLRGGAGRGQCGEGDGQAGDQCRRFHELNAGRVRFSDPPACATTSSSIRTPPNFFSCSTRGHSIIRPIGLPRASSSSWSMK